MRIIEYFEQSNEMQKYLREQIVQGDWRAAKYLYEVLEQGKLKERYGECTRLLLLEDVPLVVSTEGLLTISGVDEFEVAQKPELLAFCTLAERDEITEEETEPDMKPWIGFVYTFPNHRGNRYSEKLIRHACELAKQDGYGKIYLSSNEVGLYEKYGFVFLKMLHTVWGEETQVFMKELKEVRKGCNSKTREDSDCNKRKGGR